MLGAGDRVGRHEMDGLRQMRAHVAHDRALHRAHVGDDRAGRELRTDFLRDRAANADRHADDDEISAFDRFGIGLHHLIGDAELDDARPRLGRPRGCRRSIRTAPCARAARMMDEPIRPRPDDGERVEHRLRHERSALRAMKAASASSTARLSSSLPMVMRSASGSRIR